MAPHDPQSPNQANKEWERIPFLFSPGGGQPSNTGGNSGFPGMPIPFQWGSTPNFSGPDGNEGVAAAPTSPPPAFIPEQKQFQPFAIDSGAIRPCLYRFTYVWLNWDAFWFFPTFLGRRSVSGFRWRRNRWVYVGISLDQIQSFQCF